MSPALTFPTQPGKRSIVLLLALFPLLYLLNAGVAELRPSEALLGTIAREMGVHDGLFSVTAHGDPVEAFPMYPWLVRICSMLGSPSTWSVRLPAALSVFIMAGLAGLFALRVSGPVAGAVSAAVVLTNLALLRVGIRAQTETVLALFLSTGWMAWYIFGQQKKQWGIAWFLATLCIIGGAFTDGARAIAYFYLPFFFLKRPVRGRRRMLFPSHFVCLLFMGAVIGAWLQRVPEQPFMPWNTLRTMPQVSGSYFFHLILFPVKCAIYLLPWTAAAWTPFCMAYRQMEHRPVLFHYLRTIVLTAFISSWILPNTSPLALLAVLPLLAILTGMHFGIVVRRYRRHLAKFADVLFKAAIAGSVLLVFVWLLHVSGLVRLVGVSRPLFLGSMCGGIGVLIFTIWLLKSGVLNKTPLWVRFILAMVALRVLTLVSLEPLRSWRGNERLEIGKQLSTILRYESRLAGNGVEVNGENGGNAEPTEVEKGAPSKVETVAGDLPADAPRTHEIVTAVETGEALPDVIYQATADYFLSECFYIDRIVKRISDLDQDLPDTANTVFVLAGDKPPILPSRSWEPCSPLIDMNERKTQQFVWFPGGRTLFEIRIVPRSLQDDTEAVMARMYRGVLR